MCGFNGGYHVQETAQSPDVVLQQEDNIRVGLDRPLRPLEPRPAGENLLRCRYDER